MEIDLIDLTDPTSPWPAEVKSSETYRHAYVRHLRAAGDTPGIGTEYQSVVLRVPESYTSSGMQVLALEDVLLQEG